MAVAVVMPLAVAPDLRRQLPDDVTLMVRDDTVVALVPSVTLALDAAAAVASDGGASAGVALGEVARKGNEVDGPPVDEAVALHGQARAVPGSVWTTPLVAELARRTGAGTRDVGPVTVAPGWVVDAIELVPASTAPSAGVPLPAPLATTPPFAYVARPQEDACLQDAWATASGGVRQMVLVAGEAGVGKSRLVAERARKVHARGGVVLQGTCREDIAMPYQPLVEA